MYRCFSAIYLLLNALPHALYVVCVCLFGFFCWIFGGGGGDGGDSDGDADIAVAAIVAIVGLFFLRFLHWVFPFAYVPQSV